MHPMDIMRSIGRERRRSTCSLRGGPAARVTSRPVGVEHQRGGRPQHAEPADQVEVVLGVDLDVGDAGDRRRHVASTRRVARQGAQKALENCSSVARSPSVCSMSVPSSDAGLAAAARVGLASRP